MRKKFLATRLTRIVRQMSVLLELAFEEMPDDEATDGLPPMEQAILKSLDHGRPMPGKRVANAARYSYSARLRTTLADLCRRGLLTHSPDGYRYPSTPVPSAEHAKPSLNGDA